MSGDSSPDFFVCSGQKVCRIINRMQELAKYYEDDQELPSV